MDWFYLYKIVIKKTGQFYIGVTKCVKSRMDEHLSSERFIGKKVDISVLYKSKDKFRIAKRESKEIFKEWGNVKLLNKNITSSYHKGTSLALVAVTKFLNKRKSKMKKKWELENFEMFKHLPIYETKAV